MYAGLTKVARQSILRQFRQITRPDFFKGWEDRLAAVTQTVPTTVV
jgi:hypothetical protein